MSNMIRLSSASYVEGWHPGIDARDTVTVHHASGPQRVSWGAVVAHTHGDVLNSLPVGKAASDPGDPNPVEAEHVYNQLLANYPPKAIEWVKSARWIGPMAVDPHRVDTQDEDSWAATKEPDRVKHFAKKYKKGEDIKPGVCVQEPGQNTVKIIDGHHRFLGARKADEPYKAYVGFVDQDSGPWDQTHSFQFHQGDDPKNKALNIDKVGPKGYVHGWHFVGVAPKAGHWADHAGAAIEKEHPGVKMSIHRAAAGHVVISRIEVPKEQRGSGIGSKIMKQITDTADDHGDTIALTPSKDFGGTVSRLKTFYGRHGFKPNKGRNRDFEINEDMYRLPQKTNKSAETAELSTVHKPLGTHGLWGDKMAQLPAYIQNIAHAMIRDGHDESEAIQLAIGAVKRWAEGGGKVTPEVRAAAAKAVAEWEKLKAEHSKGKAATPDVVKVGPHGYIHGWIFVGVPGMGDAVRHPSHGKGVVEGHDDKHVTVRFASGKAHTFDVHRDASEEGHFTERGKLEHPITSTPTEHLADKVWNDPKELENLTNDQLSAVQEELLKRHEKIGVWGDEADRMDTVRSAAQREVWSRMDAKIRANDFQSAEGYNRASASRDEDIKAVLRSTERQAAEQGEDPDMIPGHRAARVEMARRADKDPQHWTVDKLPIFGGTPEQQMAIHNSMAKLMADIEPYMASKLKHMQVVPSHEFTNESAMADYHLRTHVMRINADKMFSRFVNERVEDFERTGWFSKGNANEGDGLSRVIDHEFGHHLDSIMDTEKREHMFRRLSEVIGTKDNYTHTDTDDDLFSETLQQHHADEFVKHNKAAIVDDIGTYASSNGYELLAELWAQYHGQKVNGAVPVPERADKAGDIVGHYMARHTTKTSKHL